MSIEIIPVVNLPEVKISYTEKIRVMVGGKLIKNDSEN